MISSSNRSHGPRGLSMHITDIGIGNAMFKGKYDEQHVITLWCKLVYYTRKRGGGGGGGGGVAEGGAGGFSPPKFFALELLKFLKSLIINCKARAIQ